MKLILENWRDYQDRIEAIELVEQVWSGHYVSEPLLLEEQLLLLDEGIVQFFKDTFTLAKDKWEEFENFSTQKLMQIINAGYEKILEFVNWGRKAFLGAEGDLRLQLGELFPRLLVRKIQGTLQVLQKPDYLKLGASLMMMLLQKLAALGGQALMDAVSGGTATGAKAVSFVQENIEKIKIFMQTVTQFLDPAGIKDIVDNLGFLKDAKEIYDMFMDDLKDAMVVTEVLHETPT